MLLNTMKRLRTYLARMPVLVLSCALFFIASGQNGGLFAADGGPEVPYDAEAASIAAHPPEEQAQTYLTALLVSGGVCAVLSAALALSIRKRRLLEKILHTYEQDADTKRLRHPAVEQANELRKLKRRNVRLKQLLEELEQDGEAGRRVQFSLLPRTPQRFNAYLFRHTLYPSRYFSGDFLDWFEIDEEHIGFYFADVSGHGLPSSFLTVFLKNLIDKTLDNYQSGNNRLILDPAETLHHINKEFLRQQFDKHLTLFYGIMNTTTNTLLSASGGQYPFPVLTSDENDVCVIGESAYPLGLFNFASYKNQIYSLPERFTLTIASDGFLELMEGRNLLEREAAFMQLCREGEISDLFLRKRLDLGWRETLPDDVTLLIITKE